MQKDQQIWTFIKENLAQKAVEMEESQLEKQLLQNPDFHDLMQILSNEWDAPGPVSAREIEDAFNKILQRLKE